MAQFNGSVNDIENNQNKELAEIDNNDQNAKYPSMNRVQEMISDNIVVGNITITDSLRWDDAVKYVTRPSMYTFTNSTTTITTTAGTTTTYPSNGGYLSVSSNADNNYSTQWSYIATKTSDNTYFITCNTSLVTYQEKSIDTVSYPSIIVSYPCIFEYIPNLEVTMSGLSFPVTTKINAIRYNFQSPRITAVEVSDTSTDERKQNIWYNLQVSGIITKDMLNTMQTNSTLSADTLLDSRTTIYNDGGSSGSYLKYTQTLAGYTATE